MTEDPASDPNPAEGDAEAQTSAPPSPDAGGGPPEGPAIKTVVTLFIMPPAVMTVALVFVLVTYQMKLDPLAVGLVAGSIVSLIVLVIVRFMIPRE